MIISLTQDQVAIVDDEDAGKVLSYKWCAQWDPYTKSFYAIARTKINDKWTTIQMARLIMDIKRGDKRYADHKDHNTLDNRKTNLRIVTNQQNQQNRRDVKGYSWDKVNKRWRTYIKIDQKMINLGRFTTEEEAKNTYLNARAKYFTVDTL